MELGTMKQKVFQWMGWLSIVTGLISMAFINISLLWRIDLPIGNILSLWLWITFISGIISAFNKKSRSLGLWGLGLGVYQGLFFIVMFILGWTINPFP